jgi:3-oxoacyl-(acyl-carrier-protein) synthase
VVAARSRAIAAALEGAGISAEEIVRVFVSSSGDGPRDRWETAILDAALVPQSRPRVALARRVGCHAGVGALAVAAAALAADAQAALVHGVARGGTNVALVVRGR